MPATQGAAAEIGAVPAGDSSRVRYIAVRVGQSLYGLGVDEVQEVIELKPLTRVFHAPELLGGVTNLRGEVLPVLDLSVLLGEPRLANTSSSRIVVVRERTSERRSAGLKVDGLAGLREAPESGLVALPPTVSELVREVARGVIADSPACVVLSVTALLGSPRLGDLRGGAPG